ncbi:MAG: hypothetical protein J6A46_04670 [Clostridia bacterium]|nr:hypothetical protein [Clostridia bacterium]
MSIMKKIAAILLSVFTTLLVGACGNTDSNIPKDFSVCVTYCFNGGSMENYSDRTQLTVFYKPQSYIAEPGVTTSELQEVKRPGCFAAGWYYAKEDETGKVVLDDLGNPIPGEVAFDFKNDVVTEDITLVIKWSEKIKVIFKNLYSTQSKEFTKDYEAGDAFKKPAIETSARGGQVEGYYWSYDEETDTYLDKITFGSLTYEDLKAKVGENPEKDGEYTIMYVYVKISPITDE